MLHKFLISSSFRFKNKFERFCQGSVLSWTLLLAFKQVISFLGFGGKKGCFIFCSSSIELWFPKGQGTTVGIGVPGTLVPGPPPHLGYWNLWVLTPRTSLSFLPLFALHLQIQSATDCVVLYYRLKKICVPVDLPSSNPHCSGISCTLDNLAGTLNKLFFWRFSFNAVQDCFLTCHHKGWIELRHGCVRSRYLVLCDS